MTSMIISIRIVLSKTRSAHDPDRYGRQHSRYPPLSRPVADRARLAPPRCRLGGTSLPCRGGARAAMGASSGSGPPTSRSRCARMRAITSGSSRLAITHSLPWRRAQVSISIANTRFRRCAQLIATCFGTAGASASGFAPRRRDRRTQTAVRREHPVIGREVPQRILGLQAPPDAYGMRLIRSPSARSQPSAGSIAPGRTFGSA